MLFSPLWVRECTLTPSCTGSNRFVKHTRLARQVPLVKFTITGQNKRIT
jgi:hypothetical protein